MAKVMDSVVQEIGFLREAGQKEYAHDLDDAFANFRRIADDLDLDPEEVLWTYAMKHRDGILAHIRGHESQREDVRGRINDLIVYLILLRGMVEARCGTGLAVSEIKVAVGSGLTTAEDVRRAEVLLQQASSEHNRTESPGAMERRARVREAVAAIRRALSVDAGSAVRRWLSDLNYTVTTADPEQFWIAIEKGLMAGWIPLPRFEDFAERMAIAREVV